MHTSTLTLALAWRVLCALTAHKPAHGHGHGGKVGKKSARAKANVRLLLFWVGRGAQGCVIWNHQNARLPAKVFSQLIYPAIKLKFHASATSAKCAAKVTPSASASPFQAQIQLSRFRYPILTNAGMIVAWYTLPQQDKTEIFHVSWSSLLFRLSHNANWKNAIDGFWMCESFNKKWYNAH